MTTLLLILISTFFISLISFVGIFTLFLKEKLLNKILLVLVAFSAGGLMGSAFLHLIPAAISQVGVIEEFIITPFFYVILGFSLFFILENFIGWHHHHAKEHPEISSFSYLILISDVIHNFVDGLIIAISYIAAFPLGIATTLGVTLHEIPQEIGDFGVLVYGGFKKSKALFLNFLSAIFAVLGGIFGFLLSEKIGQSIIFFLSFAAGSFIYIACSDLIPEIKAKADLKRSAVYFLVFLAGIGLMALLKILER